MATIITDEQLAEFRLKLRERRTDCMREIRHKLHGTEHERYIDLVGSAHDVADESVADLLADLGILEIDRLVREVNDIEAALLRIAHRTYGVCIDCGDGNCLSPPGRLPDSEALPTLSDALRAQPRGSGSGKHVALGHFRRPDGIADRLVNTGGMSAQPLRSYRAANSALLGQSSRPIGTTFRHNSVSASTSSRRLLAASSNAAAFLAA